MAVEVLGASTRVGHRSVHTAFLHVVTHQVITWALCSLYKECMQGVRSQCIV